MDIYLVRGDQNLNDSLALDGRNPFRMPLIAFTGTNQSVPGGVNWMNYPRGRHALRNLKQAWEAGDRLVTLGILINDTTVSQIDKDFRDVVRKHEQAVRATGPYGQGTRVCLWYRRTNATSYAKFDVLDGLITPIDLPLSDGDLWHGFMFTAFCAPHARGAVITDTVSATYTNGTTNQHYRPNVPGDYNALLKLTLDTTVSTGGVKVVRFTLGRRSNDPLLSTDFTAKYKLISVSPGVDTTDGPANYTGGHFSRVTASAAWQTIANAIQSGTGSFQQLMAQAKLRLRDSSAPLTPITNPTATPSGANGNLPEGVYSGFITTKDANGNESLPIAIPAVTVPYMTTAFFDGAEGGDTSLWTKYLYTVSGSMLYNGKASVNVDAKAAYPLGLPSLYGFVADAASGGRCLLEKAVPGAGTTISLRCRMNIQTNTGASGTTVFTQIPLVSSGGTPVISLFNNGSGWFVAASAASAGASISLPEGDWIRFEAKFFWNGAVEVATLYVNDQQIYTGNVSVAQQTSMCFGAWTTAGTALTVWFDDVQLHTGQIGANTGSIALTWTAGTNGNGYYYYSERNSGVYQQISIATIGTSSYTLTSPTAGTNGINPPTTVPAIAPALWRVGVRLSGGPDASIEWSRSLSGNTLNGNWETRMFDPLPFPPRVKMESDLSGLTTSPLWEFIVQVKAGSPTAPITVGYPTCDVDYFLLFPFDESESLCTIWSPGYTVSAAPKYVLSTRYDGHVTCDIFNSGGTIIGQAMVKGKFTFGPHDNIMVFDAEIQTAGGLPPSSDVLNTKLTVKPEETPTYEHAIGIETWISDAFNRADSLSALGSADTGQTYTMSNGTAGVKDNRFYMNTVAVNNKSFAYIDAFTPNYNTVIRATLLNPGVNEHILVFRAADTANWYALFCSTTDGYHLYRCVAGTISSVATNAQAAVASDAVVITLSGTTVTVQVNGITLHNAVSIPNNPTATIYGLGSNAAATECWDNWSVKDA